MKIKSSKILCIAVTVLMLIVIFTVSTLAADAAIIPGVGVEIFSEEIGNTVWSFVPESSGIYQIESYGAVDTVVTLYDEEGNELAYSDDESEENLNFSLRYSFKAGKTYYFEFDAYTHFTPETVTVLLKSASAIDMNSIADVKLTFTSVVENLSGEVDIYDARGDFFRYSYDVLGIEIILKNGEAIACLPEELEALTGLVLSVRDSQSYDNQWSLGENEVDVSLGAYKGKASVTVIANNLEKITVPDRNVIENTNGRYRSRADGTEWYCYNIEYAADDIEVIIGGETIKGSVDEIYEQTGFAFDFAGDQTAEKPWGIGTHKVSYTFMGYGGSYNLTVTESPVESIEIEKLTLIEGCDGFEADEGSTYFYYFADVPRQVKLTLKDGNTVTGTGAELSKYFGYDFLIEDTQSAESPWSVGNYKVRYSFMAYEGEYDVEIIPCPVKSISVKDVNLFYESEGTYYTNDEGKRVFYYESAPTEMTVYFKDGSSLCGDAKGIGKLTGYKVHIGDSQDSTPWGVGEFESSLTFMGVSVDYGVKISASPVKSVTVEDVQLYECIDGNPCEDGSGYLYDARPERITVIYKDGSAAVGNPDEIEKQTGFKLCYPENQRWSTGVQSASATFMGVKGSYSVTVKENPVTAVELVSADGGRKYTAGQLYELTGATLRVSYADGTTEECEIRCNPYSKTAEVYLRGLGKGFTFKADEVLSVGDSKVKFTVLGKQAEIDILPVAGEISSAALTKTEGENPVIILNISDGSEIKAEVLYASGATGLYLSDSLGKEREITLVTDKGSFNAFIKNEADGKKLCFPDTATDEVYTDIPSDISFTSNEVLEKAKLVYSFYGVATSFEGSFTRGNADVLMSLAAAMSSKGVPEEIHKDYYIFSRAEIEKRVKDVFRLASGNVKLSFNYDSNTDTVRVEKLGSFSNPLYGCTYDISCPVDMSFDSGCLKLRCEFTDGGQAELLFDEDGKLEAYAILEPVIHRHTPSARFGTASTYVSIGYTDSVACDTCGEVFIPRKTVSKKTLGKTAKIVSTTTTSTIKLQWQAVKDAKGYEIFYKSGSSWKRCAVTSGLTYTFKNISAGKKYTFAVKAYVQQNGKTAKAPVYTTFETATKTVAPSKVTAKQNTNAIQLNWTACKGATGYRIYLKTSKGWSVAVNTTGKTSFVFKGLKTGTKYTYAVRPYINTANGVIWSAYTAYTAATCPAIPAIKVTTPSKGTVNLAFGKVNGAENYLVYYKVGNGAYKLYKTYKSPATCKFTSLKSKTNYTFAVRAGIKTTGGWVYGSYKPVTVKTK